MASFYGTFHNMKDSFALIGCINDAEVPFLSRLGGRAEMAMESINYLERAREKGSERARSETRASPPPPLPS